MTEHSAEYQAVLQSDRWKTFSAKMREGKDCAVCRIKLMPRYMHVHHLHYGTLGCEESLDVLVLCDTCHKLADAWRGHMCQAAAGTSAVHPAFGTREILAVGVAPILRFLRSESHRRMDLRMLDVVLEFGTMSVIIAAGAEQKKQGDR